MSKKRKKNQNKCCETCSNLVACGEGDHICSAGEEKVPIMDYAPADDYMWCGGNMYESN